MVKPKNSAHASTVLRPAAPSHPPPDSDAPFTQEEVFVAWCTAYNECVRRAKEKAGGEGLQELALDEVKAWNYMKPSFLC